jgi:hypothetical protein
MISKIILCVFPDRLTAGIWRWGRLVSCQAFKNHEDGHEAFRTFLLQHSGIPIYLIVDAVEEDYRLESAPHSIGSARKALLERKLSQIYRNNSYRAAQFIGRVSDQRRDDQFLMVALSSEESIQAWVMIIHVLHAPLAGVYLLPMVTQFLVNKLKLATPHLLLMDGLLPGLRQTYFHQGQLRVSRLAPAASQADSRNPQLYMSETEKTRLYLLSQRLISAEQKLSLLVLTGDDEGEEACRVIGHELGYECLALDARKLGIRAGVRPQLLQQYPELLYMQVVARQRAPVNLAPVELLHDFLVHRLETWTKAGAASVLAAGILVSVLNLHNTLDYQAENQQALVETQSYNHRYDEVAKNFPVTTLSGADLKTVVDMAKTISDNSQTPRRLMLVLSSALDVMPEILLQRLRWVQTSNLNVADEGGLTKSANAAPADHASPPVGSGGGTLHEIGFVDGEIKGFAGDYRAAFNSVTHLAEFLRQDPRVETVTIVQQPVNVSSFSNLQGSTLDEQAKQIPAATFKLKLVLKAEVKS